ncbi:hypothetical protein BH09VER1_BH09VER1_09240 [soil metagenome]
MVPTKVTQTLMAGEGEKATFLYDITEVKTGGDYKVPLINEEIGLVRVQDKRFSRPLNYLAYRVLPEAGEVRKWVDDQAALEAHNEEVKRAAEGPKETKKLWWGK